MSGCQCNAALIPVRSTLSDEINLSNGQDSPRRVPLKIYATKYKYCHLPTPNPARVTGTQGFDKDDRREKPD